MLPEADIGIIVLTNGGLLSPDVVSYTIADLLLGEVSEPSWLERFNAERQAEQPPEGINLPESYQAAVGVFSHQAYGKVYVSQVEVNGSKFLQAELGEKTGLAYVVAPWVVNQDQWLYQLNGVTVQVDLLQGRAAAISINWEPSLPPIRFERAE
jgi:hypothetical protein